MSLDFVETTLQDRDGREHRYKTAPFRFDQGMDLKLRVMKVIAKPLGDALGDLLSGPTMPEGQDEQSETADLTQAVQGLDWSGLGDLLEQIPGRIMDAGGAALISEILSRTVRTTPGGQNDGKDLHLKLNDDLNRSRAYAGGNYGEMYQAVWWILKVNFAPFSTGNSADFRTLWERLSDWLAGITAQPT